MGGGTLHNEFACIQTKQIFPLLVPGSRIHGQPLTMSQKSSICKLVLILDCYWFCPWTYLKHETWLQWSSVWAFTECLRIKNYSVNRMILGFFNHVHLIRYAWTYKLWPQCVKRTSSTISLYCHETAEINFDTLPSSGEVTVLPLSKNAVGLNPGIPTQSTVQRHACQLKWWF